MIYVTMVKDRHSDPEPYLFSSAELAIAYAEQVLAENADDIQFVDPADRSMSPEDLERAGWLFYGCYSPEGDCVWVVAKELNEPGEVDQGD